MNSDDDIRQKTTSTYGMPDAPASTRRRLVVLPIAPYRLGIVDGSLVLDRRERVKPGVGRWLRKYSLDLWDHE